MALTRRRPYVIYDRVMESFLSHLNERQPLASSWEGFTEESCFLSDDVQTFDKKSAEKAIRKLTEAFADEEGGADFVALKVAPRVVYMLEPWPNYVELPYLL